MLPLKGECHSREFKDLTVRIPHRCCSILLTVAPSNLLNAHLCCPSLVGLILRMIIRAVLHVRMAVMVAAAATGGILIAACLLLVVLTQHRVLLLPTARVRLRILTTPWVVLARIFSRVLRAPGVYLARIPIVPLARRCIRPAVITLAMVLRRLITPWHVGGRVPRELNTLRLWIVLCKILRGLIIFWLLVILGIQLRGLTML